jgi:ABC-type polysaccharide/polyol phosphate export permease
MQIAFFLTPIMWVAKDATPQIRMVLDMNPFYPFVEISRAPFLDHPVPGEIWLRAIAITVGGNVAALALFASFRRRILYWL